MWTPKFDKDMCARIKKAIEDIGNDQIGDCASLMVWTKNAIYEIRQDMVIMSHANNEMFTRVKPSHFKHVSVKDDWHALNGEHLDINMGRWGSDVNLSIDTLQIRRIDVEWYDDEILDNRNHIIYKAEESE